MTLSQGTMVLHGVSKNVFGPVKQHQQQLFLLGTYPLFIGFLSDRVVIGLGTAGY